MSRDSDYYTARIDLFSVLEEYSEWFNRLSLSFFYPFEVRDHQDFVVPTSFTQWVMHTKICDDAVVQIEVVEKLSNLNSELLKRAQAIYHQVQLHQGKPQHEDFSAFITLYEEFSIGVRRLEREILMDGNSYDIHTGLRHAKLAEQDISRELARLERQGRSFCLGIVRVDHFDLIRSNIKQDELSGHVRLLADLIKLSLRSFDDAYYLDNGEYLLCLKQSDISGGISALERLRRELERQQIMVDTSPGVGSLMTMSCVITEPVAGVMSLEVIESLRADLRSKDDIKTDTVLQYHELSPLQRYVQESSGANT